MVLNSSMMKHPQKTNWNMNLPLFGYHDYQNHMCVHPFTSYILGPPNYDHYEV